MAQGTALPSLTPTSTPTVMRGSTAGPTPTEVLPGSCPPFALDSISADLSRTIDPTRFIGKHYNPTEYSTAFDGTAGEMLDDVHALEELFKATVRYEFLERLICRNSSGKAFFEVKDAVILNLAVNQSVARLCWAGGQPVQPVLAIGHVDLNQSQQVYRDTTGWRYDRVDMVYRIDLERETFSPLPPEGVVCLEIMEGGD